MKILKKIFGGINLTWPKLIIFALAAGVYTALMAIIPQVKETSLNTIAVSFEIWVFIGIFIIMNSKSNWDSAFKCFVFFLISQPLVYLLQVPFSSRGWELFTYYPVWFAWTVFCLPMGFIGYYIKKGKWWGYLILLPMIGFTALSYYDYLNYFTFCRPFYLVICLFCIAAMLVYPVALFSSKKIRIVGTAISAVIVTAITVVVLLNPYRYSTEILSTVEGNDLTEEYKVSIADKKMGDVRVEEVSSDGLYMVHADFKKSGKTELIVETPDGKTVRYDLKVRLHTYHIEQK